MVDLSSNPDRIITVLGLNFSPDKELKALAETQRMLPSSTSSEAELQAESPIPVKIEKNRRHPLKGYEPSPSLNYGMKIVPAAAAGRMTDPGSNVQIPNRHLP